MSSDFMKILHFIVVLDCAEIGIVDNVGNEIFAIWSSFLPKIP